MFIEHLTNNEISEFIERSFNAPYVVLRKKYYKVQDIYRGDGDVVMVTVLDNCKNKELTINLSDYNFSVNLPNRVFLPNRGGLKLDWKGYMHYKFGDKYKQAYNKYLENKLRATYEEEVIM